MNTLQSLVDGELRGARRVKISEGLTTFPRALFELENTLEELDLSGNALTSLPDDMTRFKKLRILFCSQNRFEVFPQVLGKLDHLSMIGFKSNQIRHVPEGALPSALRWLILTDNRLTRLPDGIGRCGSLQKLMLAGNQLKALPDTLQHCHRLELIRISANRLQAFPQWLTTLPRLAWMAFADNPFCDALPEHPGPGQAPASIDWARLRLVRQLGEGASGWIHEAVLEGGPHGPERVAVKLFKGEMTSDGLPASEIQACVHAGKHPSLIPLVGTITHHPLGQRGLVMRLIGGDFSVLSQPPSLQTCTRDIYPDGMSLSVDHALQMAAQIASLGAHLHRQGMLHGDLYAHNILHDSVGHLLMGDFGAATLMHGLDATLKENLGKIEARAVGCLIEELLMLARAHPQCDSGHAKLQMLDQWRDRCLHPSLDERPALEQLAQALKPFGLQSE